jgi:hypothetical protein
MQPELLSMPPLRLTNAELEAVMAAARPIAVEQRDAFLQQVAAGLASSPEIGPGVVHRVCREIQRAFFDVPDLGQGRPSRWR